MTSRLGRQVLTLPSTCTTKDLYDKAGEAFGADISELKYGFPPKKLESDATVILTSMVQNQERIQVEFGSSNNGSTAKAKTVKSKKSSTSSSTSNCNNNNGTKGGRPKRAAAKAATEAFPDVIKAQDATIASQSQSQNKNKRRPLKNSASSSPAKNQKKSQPTRTQISAAAGDGRRLADGATVQNPRKRKAVQQQPTPSTSSDMSEALLGALDNKGKMGQVLRKGMKNAVVASYEISRAFSRLAAIQARTFKVEVITESLIKVTFTGSVDKSKVEETVDLIPRDVLETVLKGIHLSNREALRPENLSRLSPRVLWSLMHEFPDKDSITECYQSILPGLEWDFLRRRAEQLSEKALENLRQEEEAKGEDVNMDLDHAAEAIHAVENAMENLHAHEISQRKSRVARAALARLQLQQQGAGTEWELVTPSEPDREELLKCIETAPPHTEIGTSDAKADLVDKLMKVCRIHNWRELANVADSANVVSMLGNAVTSEQVQKWIDHAQDESVDEIIVEICDGCTEHVERLTEMARTGTPKDLAAWRCIPESLHEQLGSDAASAITVDQIAKWTNRAHKLLQEYEWLNWYATPIE